MNSGKASKHLSNKQTHHLTLEHRHQSTGALTFNKELRQQVTCASQLLSDNKVNSNLDCHLQQPSKTSSTSLVTNSKVEKPWYELSDEEYDILLPDPMSIVAKRVLHVTSSSDDESPIS